MDGSSPITPANQGSFALFLEVVEWMTKIWAYLAGAFAAIGIGYGFEFRSVYGMPVGLGSSSVVSAIPVLAGIVLFGVTTLATYVLIPSLALWVTVGPNKRRLIDGHQAVAAGRFRNPFTSPDLGRAWLAIEIAVVVTALGALTLSGSDSTAVPWLSALSVACVMAACVMVLGPVRQRAGIEGSDALFVGAMVVVCSVFQCAVAIQVLRSVFSFTTDNSLLSTWNSSLVSFGCFVAILGAQFYVGLQFKAGVQLETFKKVIMGVLALAALPLLVPPLGARIAASVFRLTDKDGKPCVVLVPSSKAVLDDWAEILPTKGQLSNSVRLDYATVIDGYQVKVTPMGETYTIPTEQVRGVGRCPVQPDLARSARL